MRGSKMTRDEVLLKIAGLRSEQERNQAQFDLLANAINRVDAELRHYHRTLRDMQDEEIEGIRAGLG